MRIFVSGSDVGHCSRFKATRQGGRVVMVGMGPPQVKVPLVDAIIKEIDIRGVFRYANW